MQWLNGRHTVHLRGQDTYAGKAIVLLMLGIFTMGLFLYLIVAWSAS